MPALGWGGLEVAHARLAPLLAAGHVLLAAMVLLRLRYRRGHHPIYSAIHPRASIGQLGLLRGPRGRQLSAVTHLPHTLALAFGDLT